MTLSQTDIDSLVDGAVDLANSAPPEAAPQPAPQPTAAIASPPSDVGRILRLGIPLSVILADRNMAIETILALTVGSIIEFDVAFDANLTLAVGNHAIGQGHAVKVGENFGLRITEIGTMHERIDAMSGD